MREALKLGLAAEHLTSTLDTRSSLAATLASTTLTATVPDNGVQAVAFNPDGRTLATASHNDPVGGDVQLWDVADRRAPTRTATLADGEWPDAVAFSPDGRTLAVATGVGSVQLWDVADRRAPTRAATLPAGAASPHSIAFSPDGHTLASSDYGGSVQLWDVADRRAPTRTATLPERQEIFEIADGPENRSTRTTTPAATASTSSISSVLGTRPRQKKTGQLAIF